MKQKAQKLKSLSNRYAKTLLNNAYGTMPDSSMLAYVENLLLDPALSVLQNPILSSLALQTNPNAYCKDKVLLIESDPFLVKAHYLLLSQTGFEVSVATHQDMLPGKAFHTYCAIFTCLERKGFKAWLGARLYFRDKDMASPKLFLYLDPLEAAKEAEFRDYFLKQQTDHIFELPLSLEDIKKALAKDVLPLSQEMSDLISMHTQGGC